jgi:hypothetical protein
MSTAFPGHPPFEHWNEQTRKKNLYSLKYDHRYLGVRLAAARQAALGVITYLYF